MTDLAALGLSVRSDGVVVATDRLQDFGDASNDAADAADEVSNSSNTLSDKLKKLSGIAGTLVGSLAGAFSVAGYISAADAWSNMSSQVGAAIGDMSKAADMMQRLTEIANASYAPLDQTVQVYARNISVLRDLGKSADEAADFTEALNHALVITATKGEEAASVQGALSQAMAVGKLQADGLETVLANGGKVAEVLAKQLGTTVSGLRQMASDGKITGEVIANALIGNLDELRVVAAEMPATVGDGFTRINTGATALIGSFDQAVGASGALAGILVSVGDALAFAAQNIETVTGLIIAAGAAALIQFAPAIYAAVAATYAWVAATVTLKGALIATGVGALIVAAGLLIGEFLKLVTAAGGFGNAMSLLGDVAGAVWRGMIDSASAIPPALNGVWASMKAGFLDALSSMATKFHDFVWTIANGLNQVPGMEGLGGNLMGVAEAASAASGVLSKAAAEANSEASGSFDRAAATITEAFAPAREAVSRLKDVFKETKVAVDEVGVSAAATGAAMGAMGGAGKSAAEKAKEEVKELDDLATRLGSTFGDLFIAATKGADAFRSALSNVLSNLASMLANAAFTQLFKSAGGGLLGAIGDAVNALIPSANGNVFQGGSLVPFANGGVIGGPTVFPMRGGRTGLMGEAGPEAIMPLRRGRDGRLGVAAQSQQAAPVDVRVFVDQDGNWQAQVERIADRRVRQQAPTLVRQSVQAVYATNEERKLR